MSDAPLPPCPLCKTPMIDKFRDGTVFACYYGSSSHALEFVGPRREETLRRISLAAPPVHDTVREVLRNAETLADAVRNLAIEVTTLDTEEENLVCAVRAWIAAGRPGLEEKK